MKTADPTLRKIALVVAGLDPSDADHLLAQLPVAAAQRVRDAVAELEAVDPAEQETAIAEFLAAEAAGDSWSACSPPHDSTAVELDDSLARKFAQEAHVARVGHGIARSDSSGDSAGSDADFPAEGSWARLKSVSGHLLGRCLARENAQTVAVVLAQLAPSQAAEALAELSLDAQTEVLRRLTQVRAPAPELLEEIGQALVTRLVFTAQDREAAPAGQAAVVAILAAASQTDRERWARHVPGARDERPVGFDDATRSDRAPALTASPRSPGAAEPSPRPTSESETLRAARRPAPDRPPEDDQPSSAIRGLADLLTWDDRELSRLVAQAEPWAVVLALAGAAPEVATRWLARMPIAEARQIQRQLTQLGPWRLADAEEAERHLVSTARRLRRAPRRDLNSSVCEEN